MRVFYADDLDCMSKFEISEFIICSEWGFEIRKPLTIIHLESNSDHSCHGKHWLGGILDYAGAQTIPFEVNFNDQKIYIG